MYIHVCIFGLLARLCPPSAEDPGCTTADPRTTPSLRLKIPVFSDPASGKSWPLPMNKWVPEQPSPWRKSSKRESCYGDWVYRRSTN